MSSALALAILLAAQESSAPLATDRPGLLLAPTLVAPGRLQLEMSTPLWTQSTEGGARVTSASAALALRYGLEPRFELRATLPAWSVLEGADGVRQRGFADAELGFKLALSDSPARPVALVTSVRLPSGASSFTSGGPGAALQLVQGHPLGRGTLVTLAGVTHLALDEADDPTTATLGLLGA